MHIQLCEAIQHLNQKVINSVETSNIKGHVFSVTLNTRKKMIKVIGDKCIVNCMMDGRVTSVLWDTGAHV